MKNANTEANKKFNIAVIGYGGMGGWHVEKIQSIHEANLCGIYDISDERMAIAKEAGIFTYK